MNIFIEQHGSSKLHGPAELHGPAKLHGPTKDTAYNDEKSVEEPTAISFAVIEVSRSAVVKMPSDPAYACVY